MKLAKLFSLSILGGLLSLTFTTSTFAQVISVEEFYQRILDKHESLLNVKVGNQSIMQAESYVDESVTGKACFIPEKVTQTIVYRDGEEIHTHIKYEIFENKCGVEATLMETILVSTFALPSLEDFQEVTKVIDLGSNKYKIAFAAGTNIEILIPVDLNQTILNIISACDLVDPETTRNAKCSYPVTSKINREALKELDVYVVDEHGNELELTVNYGELLELIKEEKLKNK